MQTQERISRSSDRDPSLVPDGQVRDAITGVVRAEGSPEPTVDAARSDVDAALEAVDRPMTDATTADQAPQPGHVEVAGQLGMRLHVIREALLNAVNGEQA